jgi:hypothetical protein
LLERPLRKQFQLAEALAQVARPKAFGAKIGIRQPIGVLVEAPGKAQAAA